MEIRIKKGDIVNVHFVHSMSIINARVLYIPVAEGDNWHLATKEGLVYVHLFERMDLMEARRSG